ncbi:MAG: YjgN family protein [Alphaproteobacteria bacterium]
MDQTVATALPGEAAAEERHGFAFHGAAMEFFRIWIVNIALSIVTLGIYSAWAKVRTMRYFYGNTELDAHRFDYLANPLVILRGRLIAFSVLAAASIASSFDLLVGISLYYIVIPFLLVPFATLLSLRFRARMSQYRNVRFGFDGSIGGAYWAFVAWPLFTLFSFFVLSPLGYRARQHYMVGKSRFGRLPFSLSLEGWPLYKSYIIAALVGMLSFAVVSIIGGVIAVVIAGVISATGADAETDPAVIEMLVTFLNPITYISILLYVGLAALLNAYLTNYTLSNTHIEGGHRLESTLDPFRYAWISMSNMAVIGLTFGLGIPWARVRMARYRAANTALITTGSLDAIATQEEEDTSATGQEFADFMGLEIGF